MHKVMTRSGRPGGAGGRPTAGTRPAGRRDTRRPGDRTTTATTSPSGASGTPVTPDASAPAATGPVRRPVHLTDQFAERLLAVLSGQRPVHSMLRDSAGAAYDELILLGERPPLRTRGLRPVVREIGYYQPEPGVYEVFARIGAGPRLRAMAFRIERHADTRWRCTAVDLGRRKT